MGNQATKETVNVTNNSVVNVNKSHLTISIIQLAITITVLVAGVLFIAYKLCVKQFKKSVRLNARAELNDIIITDVRKTAEGRKSNAN